MDWNIAPLAKKSYLSDQPFEEGDRVASILVRVEPEVMERIDLLVAEESQIEISGKAVCRWTHVFKPKPTDGKEEAETMKLTADNLFMSLFEGEEDPSPENAKLKQFLALMLERRRVLRVKDRTAESVLYAHRPTKSEFRVKSVDLDPEFFIQNQEKLDFLVKSPSDDQKDSSKKKSCAEEK